MSIKKMLLLILCTGAFGYLQAQTVTYTAPKNISPAEGQNFNNNQPEVTISFRWTAVLPKPKEDILYKISIREIKEGQSKAQALTNKPIKIIEIKNVTQTTFKLAPRCHDCGMGFLWDVEAVSTEKGVPKSFGKSEVTQFTVDRKTNG